MGHRVETYGIKYEPRTAMKRQALGNFIIEFTLGPPAPCNLLEGWLLNVDSSLMWMKLRTAKVPG